MSGNPAGRIRQAAPLFPRLSREAAKTLAAYREIVARVHTLPARHAADLPLEIKRLSLALTAERGPGPKTNYLANPANLCAYLLYFLPWNLYRLSRLLAGLAPDLSDLPDNSSVLDLGCGPLTLVQALWIARPELRVRRLRFVCVDQTGQALRVGKALFEALAGDAGRNWSIELVQTSVHKAPPGPFRMVMAANTLNELVRGRGEEGREMLSRVADLLVSRLSLDGELFLVEPGTRFGGKLLARLRGILLEEGLSPLDPCVHAKECPMLDGRWRSWCHFTFAAEDAPEWLASLTRKAGLDKDRVSLAFLRMAKAPPIRDPALSRVVSHRFPVSGGQGAYVCDAKGLRLLTFGEPPRGMVPGALLTADLPEPTQRDPKSGVWLTPLAAEEAQARQDVARHAPQADRAEKPAHAKDARGNARRPMQDGRTKKPSRKPPSKRGGA